MRSRGLTRTSVSSSCVGGVVPFGCGAGRRPTGHSSSCRFVLRRRCLLVVPEPDDVDRELISGVGVLLRESASTSYRSHDRRGDRGAALLPRPPPFRFLLFDTTATIDGAPLLVQRQPCGALEDIITLVCRSRTRRLSLVGPFDIWIYWRLIEQASSRRSDCRAPSTDEDTPYQRVSR